MQCFIDRHELERVVREHAFRQVGYDPGAKNLTVKVKCEDATEGSPSYKVGTKARVEITEALLVDPSPSEARARVTLTPAPSVRAPGASGPIRVVGAPEFPSARVPKPVNGER
ncbi:hypothetical protein [Methylobacterium tarhaniae]|uniref:hypothetical protein n=1 Tax=Methylobacterium tarhaniae TaxID=1187852 RepID=UPI003D007FAA